MKGDHEDRPYRNRGAGFRPAPVIFGNPGLNMTERISADLVGRELPPLDRAVSWRDTTNYAAAVGDANPRYLDDTDARGLVAPPLFAVAVTWPLLSAVQGILPPSVLPTIVHAGEHLVFQRPIKPDDRLRLTGRVVAVLPKKAGTLLVLRADAVDQRGAPVFTEFSSSLLRGVACEGEGRGAEALPAAPKWDEPPAPRWDAPLAISRELPFVYDAATGIVFAIHTSRAFARMVGLPDLILQGTATLALAARELVNREAEGAPERLREIACRFTGFVIPGATIHVQLTRRQGTARGFQVVDETGKVVVSDGFAILDPRPQTLDPAA